MHVCTILRVVAVAAALLGFGCSSVGTPRAPAPGRGAAEAGDPRPAAAGGPERVPESTRERSGSAAAGDTTGRHRDERDVITFVDGNIEFLLLHEIAHLLITEKHFPIVGPTENAADYIATWALLNEEPFDPTQRDRPLKFLLSAASAFAAAWRSALDSGAQMPYWGDHALSIQRYYQVACLVYGSDPQGFARIPEIAGLPASRATDCVGEYARTDEAIRWLIATYGRKPGDAAPPATEVIYEEPRTLVSAHIADSLKSLQLLERTAERLNQRFALEKPFQLVVRSCGRPEAAWMPERRELVICYELMDYIYTLGLGEQPRRLDPALRAPASP